MALQTYETSISGLLEGQFVQNVLHWRIDNTDLDNDFLVARAANLVLFPAILGGFMEAYCDCLPEGWTGGAARTRRVSTGGGNSSVTTLDPGVYTGQRAGDSVPMTSGPLIILVGSAADNATGRIFLPGLSETDSADGRIVDALLTKCNDLVSEMLGGFSFMPGVTSYDAEWGIWDRANATFDPLLGGYPSPKIGTQRRRYVPI